MQASPLAELKDIHLPDPTSLWPLAIGWWILLVIVISTIIVIVIWQIKRWRLSEAKRRALTDISNLAPTASDWPQALHKLMRRLTISYFDQEEVAQLHGQPLVQFLTSQLKPAQQSNCQGELQKLVNAQYQPAADLDFEEQTKAIEYWIKHALPPKRRVNKNIQTMNISEASGDV
jgi:hypothetical protein